MQHRIRNDFTSFRQTLVDEAANRPLRQVQTAANFRSSNYSATQNFVNITDLTTTSIVDNTTVK